MALYSSYKNIGKPKRATKWWTPERIRAGLQRFYDDFGFCPTDQNKYRAYQEHTGRSPDGRPSNLGWHQRYPSIGTIFSKFGTMRAAWRDAGFDVDSGYLEWAPAEDWFILESVGILPRHEVAATIRRTEAAIKRRLYDLGRVTAHGRWGMPVSRAARLLGIAEHIVRRYLDHGIIPYFRGYKLIYFNPADLMLIAEFDWETTRIDPFLYRCIRVALMQRIVKILRFGASWRKHEIYRFQKKDGLFTKRISGPRMPSLIKEPAPARTDRFRVDDWISVNRETLMGVAGRVGVIKAIHYSPQKQNRRDGTCRKCWLARLEFPRLRGSRHSNDARIHYTLPLDCLDPADAPEIEPRPLKMNEEAIRGRKRRNKFVIRAQESFVALQGELT